jgi:microcystin-dependent protein
MLYSINYFITILLVSINAKDTDKHLLHQSQRKLEPTYSNDTMNVSTLSRLAVFNQLANYSLDAISELIPGLSSGKETIGNVVFNVYHFTQFLFDGNHVYIYSPKKNDENVNEPQKWTFFYVPILQPTQTSLISPWVSINKLEIRVRLALGTPEAEEAARQAIANQFNREIAEKYSKSWVIAPLMLDSLSAYIVTVGSIPIPGVVPFHIDNPNSNIITFRFVCLLKEVALVTAVGLLTGDFDIEVSLYFSGMHRVRTNMVTITATQLQSVLSKTTADGGGTNSTYIHRDQASNFIAKYVTNVKKLIYIEDSSVNTSILTHGLEEQLAALFQEGISNAKEIQIKADAFRQVWQSADLNPDRITSEMSKMFTFNKAETEKHNDKENYYSINQRKDFPLPFHAPLDVRIKTIFNNVYVNIQDRDRTKASEEYETTTYNAVSESDIKKAASQASIEGVWEGEKFIPKSFKVFRLIDVVDRLQVAVIAKQLLAEKANGAVIRRVGASTSLTNSLNIFGSLDNATLFESLENTSILALLDNINFPSPSDDKNPIRSVDNTNVLTGEIKLYAGSSPPLSPWLLCDGSIVSRLEYPRLFSTIGTKYGDGYNLTTFRLPDLRGRVPIGVDIEQLRVDQAINIGAEGGKASHTLTIEQLPSHAHDSGTFQNSYDGQHTHNLYDPGHNHGGFTSTYAVASSSSTNYGEYNYQTTGNREWQAYTIQTSFTQISLYANGNHTHQITGHTGTVGQSQSFSTLPPFQTFYYIIYAN